MKLKMSLRAKAKQSQKYWYLILGVIVIMGCSGSMRTKGNEGEMQKYLVLQEEVLWIRNGESVEYEGEKWRAVDVVENLTDGEVYLIGKFREVEFFVDKVDIKPYNRLYTKFGQNQFRVFEKIMEND